MLRWALLANFHLCFGGSEQVYLVVDFTYETRFASSITFRVRALPTAEPGLYNDEHTGLAFCLYDDDFNLIEVIEIPVLVVPNDELEQA